MNWPALAPRLLSVLRSMTCLLFMQHGLMKLFDFPGPQPGVPSPLPPLLIAAALLETIGGLLGVLGFYSRIVTFILSGQMAFAYFLAHMPKSFWPALNGGDLAILFCFVFLYLSAAGPGPWSLDARLAEGRGGA